MTTVTYNLIVRTATSRDYWAGIQKEAVEHQISGHIVIFGTHRVGVADLSETTLDGMAWKLYSELPQVLDGFEAKIEHPDAIRWAFVTKSEFEKVKRRLGAIELRRDSAIYRIVIDMIYENDSGSVEPLRQGGPEPLDARLEGPPIPNVEDTGLAVTHPASPSLPAVVRAAGAASSNAPVGYVDSGDEAFLRIYHALNSPERARTFLKRAFRL
ncbi:MAG: hypothetical protein Q8R04_03510 [Nanoarchaeota archaeon]|nr:hypothetical protein [Nanoarchaeota archaeon]